MFMATYSQARLSGIVKGTSCVHYFDHFTNCDLLVPLNGAPPGWLVKSIIFCLSTTHPPTTWLIRLTRKYRNVKARNPKMQKHKYVEYVLFADSHHPATTSSCSSDEPVTMKSSSLSELCSINRKQNNKDMGGIYGI